MRIRDMMATNRAASARALIVPWLAVAAVMVAGQMVGAQEYANDTTVGIDAKLGETIPLDLTFNDEQGQPVRLDQLVRRPTVFLLVYLRCPGICSPLMHEVAATVDKMELTPGIDYDLITVSFDAREGPELASLAKKNLLGGMERQVTPEGWRFLTGDERNIARLTDAFGYRFRKDKEDFVHSGTIMFVSPKGMIVRYLPGLKLLPAHMQMAIQDAANGQPRSFMQTIQRLCYAYDPEGKTYIVKVNRIVLAVSLVTLGAFVGYLLTIGRRGSPAAAEATQTSEEEGIADGDSTLG
jgi:protein SCO1